MGNKKQAERYYNGLKRWTLFTLTLWFKVLKLQIEEQHWHTELRPLLEAMWACPKIHLFWREVATEINKIIGMDLDFTFVTLYLGKISKTVLQKDK